MNKREGEKGFIGLIILIILGLAALKYFLNWDIFDAAQTDQGKTTILYVRDIVNFIWSYLSVPVSWIWHNVLLPFLLRKKS